MNTVEFNIDELDMPMNKHNGSSEAAPQNWPTAFLLRLHIVKTERAASRVLFLFVIAAILIAALIFYRTLSPDARLTMTPQQLLLIDASTKSQ